MRLHRFAPGKASSSLHDLAFCDAVRLRLAYWVAQVCNADAPDHRRVAKDDWRAGEAVEESNSGAKKNRRDVEVDFVEEPSIQQLLDGVGAVDANGLPGGGGFGLVHGAFEAVGHEVYSRASAREHGTKSGHEPAKVLGARRGYLERH